VPLKDVASRFTPIFCRRRPYTRLWISNNLRPSNNMNVHAARCVANCELGTQRVQMSFIALNPRSHASCDTNLRRVYCKQQFLKVGCHMVLIVFEITKCIIHHREGYRLNSACVIDIRSVNFWSSADIIKPGGHTINQLRLIDRAVGGLSPYLTCLHMS
jgi:hypothetical protein